MTTRGIPIGIRLSPPVEGDLEPDWRTQAVCRAGIDDDVWFPRTKGRTSMAKRVCNGPDPVKRPELICPVKDQCLKYALDKEIVFGVWGGLDGWELAQLLGQSSPTRKTRG